MRALVLVLLALALCSGQNCDISMQVASSGVGPGNPGNPGGGPCGGPGQPPCPPVDGQNDDQNGPAGQGEDVCGDGVCSPAERDDKASCVQDCISVYEGFEDEIETILSRTDNTKRNVNMAGKQATVEKMRQFASTLGIETANLQPDQEGRQYASIGTEGEIHAYFDFTPAQMDANTPSDMEEFLAARQTWSYRAGAADALPDQDIVTIAEGARQQYGLPGTNQQGDDTPRNASTRQLRQVEDETTTAFLQQTMGYYRTVGERQVANSTFLVEVDPATTAVCGMSLRNWWPLENPEQAPLKQKTALIRDILTTMAENGSKEYDIVLTSCQPSYCQFPTALVPAVTCRGVLRLRSQSVASSLIEVVVSMTTESQADEIVMVSEAVAVETDPLPTDYGDTGGARFGVYYSTDEDRFIAGARKFRDKFSSTWSDYDYRWAYYTYFVSPYTHNYVDNADLIYVLVHGSIRSFSGQDDRIWMNNTTHDVAQTGTADLEYFVTTTCNTASAVRCEGMSAVKRYTDTDLRDTVFTGIHIYSGHHGTALSSTTIQENKATKYARYLDDGMTLLEAWYWAGVDAGQWHSNVEEGCAQVYNPDNTDPDGACNTWGTEFTCSRWTSYPSSFYIDCKRGVTIYNRGDYMSDPRKGDADYDVDLMYSYHSETVPLSAAGYSLP